MDCREESPMAETNASASYISSPQTIAEMHPLSVSIVKLDGTLFGTNFKPSISNDCSQGEKIFSSTSPRHSKKSEFS
jgi:hypothetical protein